jgi:predicted porin
MNKIVKIGCITLVFCHSLFSAGYADDNGRIDKLEKEVAELRRMVQYLAEQNKTLRAAAPSGQPIPQPSVLSKETAVPSVNNALLPPKLELRGFGHAQYDISRQKDKTDGTKSDTNHFTTGGVDLFITSRINEQINFLNETLFEFDESGGARLDVERVLLKYDISDKFKVSLGRGHTALGYWNQTFHHGQWLMTTVGRPILYNWEDEGGILPAHYVGLEFSGALEAPGGELQYVSNVANGRGTITDHVQLIQDANDSKMLSSMVTYKPEAIDGLSVGGNFLFDLIPAKPDTANRDKEIDEFIYGTHLVYLRNPYEFIVEALAIDHYNRATELKDKTYGAYAQVAYKIKKYKPYFRFDWLNVTDSDPFYTGLAEDVSSYTAGLRYDLSTWNAIKAEYRFSDFDKNSKNEATIQSSFFF